MTKKYWVGTLLGLCFTSWASLAAALPVTITIHDIELRDPDVNQDVGAPFDFYMVSSARIGSTILPVEGIPHVGVCATAPETDPTIVAELGGCHNHVNPSPGMWSFTADVDPALGTVNVLIQVRNRDASHIDPIDMTPGNPVPSDRGLRLILNLTDGTWRVQGDPSNALSPTIAQSSLIGLDGRGPFDSNVKTGRVHFDVSFCAAASCSDASGLVCEGSPCTTGSAPMAQCSNLPGTVSCSGSAASCVATPLSVPEQQNGLDDDCDGRVDECNADQVGQTIACSGQVGTCPMVPGTRTCEAAEQPPGPCLLPQNVCQPRCANEILVTNVPELRAAVQQAALTDCKDVIVLAPGVYDLFDQQLAIHDSLELRGQGSSFGCEGLDLAAFSASTLSPDLGSARCDGDEGEDPSATVLTTTRPVALNEFRRVLDIGEQGTAPEVTLRHLTIRGGYSDSNFQGDEGVGIRSQASRLELYNVVVERNVAPAPGAAIDHRAGAGSGPGAPSFIMVNSTVRENRCTTNSAGGGGFIGLQGDGGGMRLKGGHSFILRSSIVHNAALRGAGISAYGRLSIFNSTISGNVAGEQAAGIWFTSEGGPSQLLELHHTTVTNNVAQWIMGGGGSTAGAGIGLRFGNTVQLLGSIVAGNITCSGEARVWCEVDADCPAGGACFCPDPEPDGTCQGAGFCAGGDLYPPNLDNTNLCAQADTNCLALVEPGQPSGTFESWGSNVASSDCAAQSSFLLPSGVTASDAVVDLRLGLSCSDARSPFQTAVDLFCYRGLLQGSNVGGQNSDPNQPAGDVPPPAGAAFLHDFVPAFLVGPLADNGGPTPTHAVPSGSLAAGVGRTLADPGDVADAFSSTVPACPVTDQRGFASALGERPSQCDAGSFQSAATSQLSADELADELSLMSPDTDGDGIADLVDTEPEIASLFFGDSRVGGWTSGQILSAGDQVLRIFDVQPNPLSGVVILGLSEGGAEPALVRACNGNLQLLIEAGEIEWINCPQQPGVCVLATEDLSVRDRAEVAVDGVLGGEVSLGQALLSSDVYATGDLVLQRTSVAGNAVAASNVIGAQEADVEGAVSEAAYLVRRTVATRELSVGIPAIVVGNDQSLELAPGAHGSLAIGDRGRLRLLPGRYTFASASLGNDTILELSGFVQIDIESSLQVGDRVQMRTPAGAPASADLVEWYTNATAVSIGHDVAWAGTLLAPHASVTLKDRASVDGCLATRSLTLGHDSSIASSGQLALIVFSEED